MSEKLHYDQLDHMRDQLVSATARAEAAEQQLKICRAVNELAGEQDVKIISYEAKRAQAAEKRAEELAELLERSQYFIRWLMDDGVEHGPEEYERFMRKIDAVLDQPAGTPDIVTNVGPGKDAR